MTDDSAIARSVLAEQVKDRLLQDILAGRYPANTRIVETRVARQLGTSQAPVREALRGLEALGVIEILPFRGARVRHPSRDELLEAYAVRVELEALRLDCLQRESYIRTEPDFAPWAHQFMGEPTAFFVAGDDYAGPPEKVAGQLEPRRRPGG